MTNDIWDWQCKIFVYSCYLYEHDLEGNYETVLDDQSFDQHAKWLLDHYNQLPQWFKDRVSQGDLTAGTGMNLTYNEEEIMEAINWRQWVKNGCPDE